VFVLCLGKGVDIFYICFETFLLILLLHEKSCSVFLDTTSYVLLLNEFPFEFAVVLNLLECDDDVKSQKVSEWSSCEFKLTPLSFGNKNRYRL
jgi:hypothetical protein